MSHFVSTALICTGDAGRSAGVKDLNYANLNIASNNWTTLCFGQCCQVFLQQIDQILSKNVPNAYKNHRCNCVRLQKFFQGGANSTFCLSFPCCWRCNENACSQNALPFLHHDENVPLVRQQSQKFCFVSAAMLLFHSWFFSHCTVKK